MQLSINVGIIMGSESDMKVMNNAGEILKEFGLKFEFRILSAHRTPDLLHEYIIDATSRGAKIFIAGAGAAAHLAGVIASHTMFPVIGVPLANSPLNGFDALLSTVQMPAGIPVATVAIGDAGAKNAAFLAIEILALADEVLQKKLREYRDKMVEKIKESNANYA